MKSRVAVLSSLLALMLLSLAMSAEGAVDWTDSVTDPLEDIHDSSGGPVTGREDIDILSVGATEAGADLNVTLKLAGHYNATAEYTVDLLADGRAGYRLTWEKAFAAAGPSGAAINVMGHMSRDGTTLSWVIAKSSVAATKYIRVDKAEAKLTPPGGMVCTDTAKGTPQYDEVQLPKTISVRVVYEQLHLRNITITVAYEGANASAVRAALDLDADGTVSSAEASAHAAEVRQAIVRETTLHNSTLDGRTVSRETYGFELQGAEGAVTGTAPVRFTIMQTMEFPLPETRGSHIYYFESAIGGDEPWDNEPMGDDPWGDEFLGDDDPWENVFFGGFVPWEAQAIGGDEPWDNVASVVFRVEAPEGWRFVTKDWPAGLAAYVNSDGDVLEMDAEATASSYATTIGKMNMLTFEEVSNDEDGGFIPAHGAMLALIATGMVAGPLALRRGRALRP